MVSLIWLTGFGRSRLACTVGDLLFECSATLERKRGYKSAFSGANYARNAASIVHFRKTPRIAGPHFHRSQVAGNLSKRIGGPDSPANKT